MVFWTNLTNCGAALHLCLFSDKVSCLSPGYRGQKGERGQLGLGLPGDPGQMGPPGKKNNITYEAIRQYFEFVLTIG